MDTFIRNLAMSLDSLSTQSTSSTPEICDYVTQLQLHMALQAKHLIPALTQPHPRDSRMQLLHQAQADMEKSASRQWL